MSNYISIHTTIPLHTDFMPVINQLLSDKLAACIQVSAPISSSYIWKNSIETTAEHQLIIKTTKKNYQTVRDTIINCHPYDIPQLYSTEWVDVLPEYKEWVDGQLT